MLEKWLLYLENKVFGHFNLLLLLSIPAITLATSIQQYISDTTRKENLMVLIFKKILVSQREQL